MFSYPSPKPGSGDCSIGEVCKNKNNFHAQKQSIFLILMHQGAKISIPKANHRYMQINRTDLTTLS